MHRSIGLYERASWLKDLQEIMWEYRSEVITVEDADCILEQLAAQQVYC